MLLLPLRIYVWSPEGLNQLKKSFEHELGEVQLKFVWLKCELPENHRRDQLRITENQMKARVDIVNAELLHYKWPAYLNIIDTTHLTEAETLNQIEKLQ